MRIAVQMFGHLRTYKKCYKYLRRNLLDKYDCDIFMHTWSSLDHNTLTHHNNRMIDNTSVYTLKSDLIKKITKISENLLIEDQIIKDIGNIRTIHNLEVSIFGIKSMFYSMGKANELREKYAKKNDIVYDFVLFIRPDILLKKEFNIDFFIQSLSSKEINNGFFTTGYPFLGILNQINYIGLTDVLFFAKPSIMSDIFYNQHEITKGIFDGMKINGPETFLMNLVETKKYQIYLVDYRKYYDFEICRPTNRRSIRKKLFRLRVKNGTFSIYILQILLNQIFRIKFDILGKWTVDICVGALNDKLK